jgi:uracil phosphoribosyltransferase
VNNTSNHYNVNGCIETPDLFNELQYRSSSVHNRVGYRLLHEEATLIVPLMRGGEPMAFGVNEAFPLAMPATTTM